MPRSGATDTTREKGLPTAGQWRFGLYVLRGFDYDGSHPEDEGTDPSGAEITVPVHEHRVSLDLTRIELEAGYTFLDGWEARLRVPWDIKEQRASLRFRLPMTQAEMDAAWRHLRVHHRDATYDGLGDLQLLTSRRWRGLLVAGDAAGVAAGLTIPTGRTVRDPYALGEAGLRHTHLQFGTGTFDPLLELDYGVRVWKELEVSAFGWIRASLYENPKDYRGPFEFTSGLNVAYPVWTWLAPHANYTFIHQGVARWDGERDTNTGLQVHTLTIGATTTLGADWRLGLDVRFVLDQRTLVGRGEAFELGPTVLLNLTYVVRPSQPKKDTEATAPTG